jgi:hypothetical protein
MVPIGMSERRRTVVFVLIPVCEDDPPAQLRRLLADDRRRDVPFSHAWPQRLAEVVADPRLPEREQWANALGDLETAWRAGYERTGDARFSDDLLVDAA